MSRKSLPPVLWPGGKRFAFTVFDDTDFQTVENGRPVYDFLRECGFRTTKSVWPLKGAETPRIGGMTCEDPEYLRWVLCLQKQGFEIGLHNVTYHTSARGETLKGLERFRELFGHYPRTAANHSGCREAIYWGSARLDPPANLALDILARVRHRPAFEGHVEGSPYFWGDACQEKIGYLRNFVYGEINTLKACPYLPYYDPRRPFVGAWFASSEGPNIHSFVDMVSEERQDRLEKEGGLCIMYTHFACGFERSGNLHPRFRILMERLARKDGWFVPVATILDHLRDSRGIQSIGAKERQLLQNRWLAHKIRTGGTS